VDVTRDETERAELIAALHQSVAFGEGMLELNERLLDALSPGDNPPDAEAIEYMRAGPRRWQEQMTMLRQRLASVTIDPPNRPQ
jgi:hypothetical protein